MVNQTRCYHARRTAAAVAVPILSASHAAPAISNCFFREREDPNLCYKLCTESRYKRFWCRYIAKESLWPYIHEFVDGALNHIVNMARAIGEQVNGGKPTWPYVIHGHYADAGEVAAHLSGALNVPMVLTGHSLGRNKFEQLLKQGRLPKDINASYKIMRRIEAEELGLDASEMVVTSTRQEIEMQWGLYDGFDLKLERKLRVRRQRGVSCFGRFMPRMVV